MKRALFLFLPILLVGCIVFPPVSAYKSRHGVEIRGQVTEKEVEEIDRLLDFLPIVVVKAIPSISSREDSNHFNKNEAGHCHYAGHHICIKQYYVTQPNFFWHEVCHAYSYSLSSGFCQKLRQLTGDSYGKNKAQEWGYPKNGILTSYGATDPEEDVAEWFTAIYQFLSGQTIYNPIAQLQSRGEFKNLESVYYKKLQLLLEYGFITEENFRKIVGK